MPLIFYRKFDRYPPLNESTIVRFEYVVQLDLASERDLYSIPSYKTLTIATNLRHNQAKNKLSSISPWQQIERFPSFVLSALTTIDAFS